MSDEKTTFEDIIIYAIIAPMYLGMHAVVWIWIWVEDFIGLFKRDEQNASDKDQDKEA